MLNFGSVTFEAPFLLIWLEPDDRPSTACGLSMKANIKLAKD